MAKSWFTARRNLALGVAVLLLASACDTGPIRADDQRKQVVTTFTVIADMARNIAGGKVAVHSITKPGAEIHQYEPTPSDLLTAAKADLVLDNGLGLEQWFEQFVQRSESEHVTLSQGVRTLPISEGEDGGAANPHAWMSPRVARTYVANIRDAFTRLDPAHAEAFHANARRYLDQLDGIEDYLQHELATVPERNRVLVTCEGAFSYLARDAGLHEAYLWPVNADSQGTPQQIQKTTRLVRDRDVRTVFCESTVSDKAQRQVAEETGARLDGPLYVDSLSTPNGPVPTYLDLLRHDARTIVNGLREART